MTRAMDRVSPKSLLSGLDERASAALAVMSKRNPHRQLILDLMTVIVNLADTLKEVQTARINGHPPESQAIGDEAV